MIIKKQILGYGGLELLVQSRRKTSVTYNGNE